jgi:hypothetical protein
MKKAIWVVCLSSLSLLIVQGARAGYKLPAGVYIDTASRYAVGTLGAARNSADTVQYISCSRTASVSGGNNVSCAARNADATPITVSCFVTDPAQVAALSPALEAMNGDSRVYFYWDSAGRCTNIVVQNSSYFEPKL